MHAEVCAAVAEGKGRQRRRLQHRAKRRAIIEAVSAPVFDFRIANSSVAIDGKEDDRRRVVADLRAEPVTADQRLHPLDVDAVGEVAPFERGYACAANRHLRRCWLLRYWVAGLLRWWLRRLFLRFAERRRRCGFLDLFWFLDDFRRLWFCHRQRSGLGGGRELGRLLRLRELDIHHRRHLRRAVVPRREQRDRPSLSCGCVTMPSCSTPARFMTSSTATTLPYGTALSASSRARLTRRARSIGPSVVSRLDDPTGVPSRYTAPVPVI